MNCPKNCSCYSCADGSNAKTDLSKISQMGGYINNALFGGKGTNAQVKAAYPVVMVYLDHAKLPQTEQSIKDNIEGINKAIADPNYLKAEDSNVDWKKLAIVIGLGLLVLIIIKKM